MIIRDDIDEARRLWAIAAAATAQSSGSSITWSKIIGVSSAAKAAR